MKPTCDPVDLATGCAELALAFSLSFSCVLCPLRRVALTSVRWLSPGFSRKCCATRRAREIMEKVVSSSHVNRAERWSIQRKRLISANYDGLVISECTPKQAFLRIQEGPVLGISSMFIDLFTADTTEKEVPRSTLRSSGASSPQREAELGRIVIDRILGGTRKNENKIDSTRERLRLQWTSRNGRWRRRWRLRRGALRSSETWFYTLLIHTH